ncbi:MAG: ribonuclease E/G [Pseudomonadota bacterium]
MPTQMLIDASHREETRVVVKRGNRVEEFDYETAAKQQLRGNIYLAKVTRVEPSLQAAFVDYGGNRHGFLAFSEIHPDYYQIPQADRDALIAEELEAQIDASDDDDEAGDAHDEDEAPSPDDADAEDADAEDADVHKGKAHTASDDEDDGTDGPDNGDKPETLALAADGDDSPALTSDDVDLPDTDSDDAHSDDTDTTDTDAADSAVAASEDTGSEATDGDEVDDSGADDAIEEARPRRRSNKRRYKIQEVIKRRQIILVQVVKEERGNKGAALTTYLSLAGRYAVLMPNTPRGGGISRKITSATDRKRLKAVVSDLDVPEGMGVILRTAGANRTKVEIKRDFEYMMRLWETVRDLTLKSAAPALVYEEGSLIKRSIRDLYSRDIDHVLVSGEDGYREAKDFMRMLMPSHARNVQPYRDPTPLFTAYGVEDQLDTMFEPTVRLKSGGYLVINQTEALVAIDVNSGKSTKEHNIEDTAVQTNLEAADEIARQLRLRDLAGLVVCDFIDMEEKRNNRAVEKRMKDALKSDRARIQVGRISHFGLLEMSRQRIRTSLLESTMVPCPDCNGTGFVRSDSSVSLQILRQAEAQMLRHQNHNVNVTLRSKAAFYILNNKREMLADLEARYGRKLHFIVDETIASDAFTVVRGDAADPALIVPVKPFVPVVEMDDDADDIVADEDMANEDMANEDITDDRARSDEEDGGEGRRRRRRRKRRRSNSSEDTAQADSSSEETSEETEGVEADGSTSDEDGDGEPKRRRRSRRGGRRRRGGRGNGQADVNAEAEAGDTQAVGTDTVGADTAHSEASNETDSADEDASPVGTHSKTQAMNGEASHPESPDPELSGAKSAEPTPTQAEAEEAEPPAPAAPKEPVVESSNPDASAAPKKQGWWQRRSFFG